MRLLWTGVFDSVHAEIGRRQRVSVDKGRYSNRYVWSGKIKCAYCNLTFKPKNVPLKSGKSSFLLMCSEADRYGKEKVSAGGQKVECNCKTVHERALRDNFLAVLNMVIENKDYVIEELRKALCKAIDESPDKSGEIKEVGVGMEKITMRKSSDKKY